MVIKTLIEFRLVSSINSRNATRVADVLSRGDIFVLIFVGRLVSMHGGVQVFFSDLWWCFLLYCACKTVSLSVNPDTLSYKS